MPAAASVWSDRERVHCGDHRPHLRHRKILEGQTTKIKYDPVHDLLNLEFLGDGKIEGSVEIDGIILDEILDASKRTAQEPLQRLEVSIVRVAATYS